MRLYLAQTGSGFDLFATDLDARSLVPCPLSLLL